MDIYLKFLQLISFVPEVDDRVRYWDDGGKEWSAVVAAVKTKDLLDLCVRTKSGQVHYINNVERLDEKSGHRLDCWDW